MGIVSNGKVVSKRKRITIVNCLDFIFASDLKIKQMNVLFGVHNS